MQTYKFFWQAHKWTGIVLSVVLLNVAISGILLLEKKRFAWIQPRTMTGAEGGAGDFIGTQALFAIVFGQGNADFVNMDDIDRVDFRPGKRVFKVRSKHNYAEIQVDAVTGKVLSVASRPSDLLETLHDGSYYAESVHAILMPATGGGLILLSVSGLYLWLATWMRKRRQKRK